MVEVLDKFIKEEDGQYSFWDISCSSNLKEKEITDTFVDFVIDSRKEVMELLKVKDEYSKYKNLLNENDFKNYAKSIQQKFEVFIERYFDWFDSFPYEEILKKYEDFSTDYHNVGKVFLIYLHSFVYEESVINQLNQNLCICMENFVKADPIRYSDKYYAYIKNVKIAKRQKLRVDGYIVYRIKPFLQRMERITNQIKNTSSEYEKAIKEITTKTQIREMINEELKCIRNDESLYKAIFEQGSEFVKEKNQEVLAMLFLKYLELCVYYGTVEYPSEDCQKFVAKIEDYVVYHIEDGFCFTKVQEKTYELAKEQVAKRIENYVNKEGNYLLSALKDYDKLLDFKNGFQFKMIEENDNVDELPTVYSEEEIKQKLEVFLGTVFMLSKSLNKERIPIFSYGLEEQRDVSLTLALEYLNRFVYKVSKDYLMEDKDIICLENFIVSCECFRVEEATLCLAKSTLYARVNIRNTLKDSPKRRKVLQSPVK